MTDVFQKLSEYMSYPFVRYALAAGILIALCASLLGVILVLKRYSFIGDGLSHVAFGAMAAAAAVNFAADTAVVMVVTVISAIFLLKSGKNTKIKGDAAIAMVSVGALAIGYLIMNVFSTSPNVSGDVCSTLFGSASILTLSKSDVMLCTVMSVIVIFVFTFLYNKIFAVTFDEAFAKATGINTNMYNSLIAVITAIIIVLAMTLVGSLLTSALIIFPALTAMRIFKSFKKVMICSCMVAVLSAGMGMIISILVSVPAGSMIVVVDIAIFVAFTLIGKLTKH